MWRRISSSGAIGDDDVGEIKGSEWREAEEARDNTKLLEWDDCWRIQSPSSWWDAGERAERD